MQRFIELQSIIIAAQQQTLAIQQSHAVLEAKTRDLEAECVRLKDWSREKQNYALREIAPGVFAYAEKQFVGAFQQAHKYCCNCFDHDEKSLLQQTNHMLSGIQLNCPRCPFKAIFNHYLR
jgi:hypothetical protein